MNDQEFKIYYENKTLKQKQNKKLPLPKFFCDLFYL